MTPEADMGIALRHQGAGQFVIEAPRHGADAAAALSARDHDERRLGGGVLKERVIRELPSKRVIHYALAYIKIGRAHV